MPVPDDDMTYDKLPLEMDLHQQGSSLIDEQKAMYEQIINATFNYKGGIYYIYGYGFGKIYRWRKLFVAL